MIKDLTPHDKAIFDKANTQFEKIVMEQLNKPNTKICNTDCMKFMAEYADNYFDLAICDPPYGINVGAMGLGKGRKLTNFENKKWDDETPTQEYFTELQRVSKNQIIWGGNYFTDKLPVSKCYLIWDKIQEFSGADFEMAWTSFNRKIHPTQKPVSLYRWCLKNYATEGMKILDTHLGSGTIAIALENVNRIEKLNLSLFASEIDLGYYEDAIKLIKECNSQRTFLF